MKNLINKLVLAMVLGVATTGRATISFSGSGGSYTAVSTGSASIPDYPSSGIAFALNFADAYFSQITSISVTFTTTGGWNGDLYAYLSHGDGLAILLNQVGANAPGEDGYGTSGFNNITLTTSGTDIHTVATPTTGGSYASDGRLDYTSSTRDNTLNVFTGANPNGDWTLFFSDQAGLNTASLDSFNVSITAVPEPINIALGVFGGLLGGFALVRYLAAKRRAVLATHS